MTATKRCTKCGETKPLAEYHKDASTDDGHARWCKACVRVSGQAYYRRRRSPAEAKPSAWVPFTCEICGKVFRYPRPNIESRKRRGLPMPRFCSQACSNYALNHRRVRV